MLGTGVMLMRLDGLPKLTNLFGRSVVYWAHVITPLLAVWLYVIHRLAGPRIKYKVGLKWAGVVGAVVAAMVVFALQDPRKWNVTGPKEGAQYFRPSLARTLASRSGLSASRTGPASTRDSGREPSPAQAANASTSAPTFLRGTAPPTCRT